MRLGRRIKVILTILKKPFLLIKKTTIGKGSLLGSNILFHNVKIGRYCFIGGNSSYNDAIIGNYCNLAMGVQIGGMEHSYRAVSMSPVLSNECIDGIITHIGNDVWIGADSIIKQGITIGDGAVVGANSFVNKDVPPYAIVFGTPAKVFKFRFDNDTIETIRKSNYWNYPPNKAIEIIKNIKKK
jgi:acetyltransferase-like isoleucine patch superfamily enzyme